MRLMDLLNEDSIRAGLAGESRDDVIRELVELLVAQGALPESSRERSVAAVLRREASQTTGLGSGVAIPHGVCDEAGDVIGAMGVHRDGVDFAAVDGQPVHIVILLLVPPNRFQAHVRTLAGIARVLNDPQLRRSIIEASDPAAIMDILVAREEAAV